MNRGNNDADAAASLTPLQVLKQLQRDIKISILESDLNSTDPQYQAALSTLIDRCADLWALACHSGAANLFSRKTDTIDEIDSIAMQFLVLPHTLGDLWQRVQVIRKPPEQQPSSSSSQQALPPVAAAASTRSGVSNDNDNDLDPRVVALTNAQRNFEEYIELAVDIGLTTEKDMEQVKGDALQRNRTARIELTRRQMALQKKLREKEGNLEYQVARQRRMKQLMSRPDNDDDGNAEEDNPQRRAEREQQRAEAADEEQRATVDGNRTTSSSGNNDDEEQLRREVALLRLQWCLGDSVHQLNLLTRELELIGGEGEGGLLIDKDKRARIAAAYQGNIALWRERGNNSGKQTYTILPGGRIAAGGPISLASDQTFREQVQADMVTDRHGPTMSLQEFAAKEMAEVQRQQDAAARKATNERAEEARLGKEGVEERDRQKKAHDDDWRDDHPAYGLSNKGNYS